jgi:Zn-dependent metalloprotease
MQTRFFSSLRSNRRSARQQIAYRGVALAALGLLVAGGLGCSGVEGETNPKQASPIASPDVDGSPLAEVLSPWNELRARSEGEPAVRWGERGTPLSVFGVLSAARGDAGADAARDFLAENAGLFKLSAGLGELVEARTFDTPMGRHVVFEQRYQGVPVYGAEIKVHFNGEGRVVALNNSSVPGVRLASVAPALPADLARAVVAVEVQRQGRDGRAVELADDDADAAPPELVVYAGGGAPVLAWRVVTATAAGPTMQAFVDAASGAVVGAPVDVNRYVNGTGQIFKDNAVVATKNNNLLDQNDSAAAVPTSAYSTVTLQGLTGNGKLDGQFASGSASKSRASSSANSFIFTRNTKAFSETMAYFHIDLAQRYIQSLGFTNVNNRQQVFAIDRLTADNSFYSPSNRQISFGTGGVDDAEDGEVIVHEYGHSIQDNQVPGFGSSLQGGSMGEGFGDYWAATVNATLVSGFQETCVAEWDATSYASGVPHCLRTLDSTKHFPEDVAGEVHDDGELWSASLWQIRTLLGAAKADKLVLQAHFLLSSNANFSDGSNALVTAAKNLGLSTAEVSGVRTILQSRGFTVTA